MFTESQSHFERSERVKRFVEVLSPIRCLYVMLCHVTLNVLIKVKKNTPGILSSGRLRCVML